MRLADDWKHQHKRVAVLSAWAGSIFTGVGVAASYAGSALAWLPVLSFRTVCLIAFAIFVCVLAGQLLRRGPAPPDDTDQAGA